MLHARLDAPLPAELAAGAGTARFVCGTCHSARDRIAALALLVDGEEQPLLAAGMPRLDLLRSHHPGLDPYAAGGVERDPAAPDDPLLTSYRSGFWGLARIRPRRGAAECAIGLRARLADGTEETAELARLTLAGPAAEPVPAPPGAGPDLVAICMATHDPPRDLFARQVESIRAQTHADWVCVISDDRSSEARPAGRGGARAGPRASSPAARPAPRTRRPTAGAARSPRRPTPAAPR